jgi:hypothetical protein
MSSGGTYVSDTPTQHHFPIATDRETGGEGALDEIRASLKNLRYGSVTIIVQDGVIIQIDRTEKRRLQSRRTISRGQ